MVTPRKISSGLLAASLLLVFSAGSAFAQSCPVPPNCYDFAGNPPTLGCYFTCALPGLFTIFQIIAVTVSIILAMALVTKAAMNRENSEFLSGLPNRLMYVIILAFLAAGFGGTLVNFVLQFFGFGEFQDWLDVVNSFLKRMDEWERGDF